MKWNRWKGSQFIENNIFVIAVLSIPESANFLSVYRQELKHSLHVWDNTEELRVFLTQGRTKAHGQPAGGMPKREWLARWACLMFASGRRPTCSVKEAAQSTNDPPQPAVPTPFYANHHHTKKTLECTLVLSHVWNSLRNICNVKGNLQQFKHLSESKQASGQTDRQTDRQTEQWRAPLTAGVTNQRSPVAKLLNQVQRSFLSAAAELRDHSQKSQHWLRSQDYQLLILIIIINQNK